MKTYNHYSHYYIIYENTLYLHVIKSRNIGH